MSTSLIDLLGAGDREGDDQVDHDEHSENAFVSFEEMIMRDE